MTDCLPGTVTDKGAIGPEQRSWLRRAGAGLTTVQSGRDKKVICPKCRATTDLGPNGADLSDAHYKLECPVLRERRIAKGSDIKIECLYMRRARDRAILKLHRGRKSKRMGAAF
jgi:hypothetical protein